MALNPLNSSNLEQLALKVLMRETASVFCTPGVEILQSTVAVAVADDDSDVKSSARCLLNVFRLSFWR